jgi:hypothetical protein
MLDSDDRLLAGEVKGADLAEAICSARRMGLADASVVH